MRPLNGGGGKKSQEKQCVAALMTPLLEKPGVRGPSTTGGDVVKKKLPAIIWAAVRELNLSYQKMCRY